MSEEKKRNCCFNCEHHKDCSSTCKRGIRSLVAKGLFCCNLHAYKEKEPELPGELEKFDEYSTVNPVVDLNLLVEAINKTTAYIRHMEGKNEC